MLPGVAMKLNLDYNYFSSSSSHGSIWSIQRTKIRGKIEASRLSSLQNVYSTTLTCFQLCVCVWYRTLCSIIHIDHVLRTFSNSTIWNDYVLQLSTPMVRTNIKKLASTDRLLKTFDKRQQSTKAGSKERDARETFKPMKPDKTYGGNWFNWRCPIET